MYEYRKMSPDERKEVLAHRRLLGFPLHAPPHFGEGGQVYLLTAACYGHAPILAAEARRQELADKLQGLFQQFPDWELRAWSVLPTHYHVLALADLDRLGRAIGRLHNGTSTQWNREDAAPGRKVWHRFSDRRIRGERHYWAAMNYVHGNPVRHGYVPKATDWPASSVHEYMADLGRERLIEMWRQYPVDEMGKGWDD